MPLTLPERLLNNLLEAGAATKTLVERLSLIAIVMLIAAMGIWLILGRKKKGYAYTSLYWLVCSFGIWVVLHRPIEKIIPSALLTISLVSFIFSYIPIFIFKRRVSRSWPERLEDLTLSYKPPEGLISSITGLSLFVFFLGLCYITSATTARASVLIAISIFLSIRYEYRPESAMAGIMLFSLGVISGVLDGFGSIAVNTATLINLVIISISILSLVWTWLGGYWEKQIIHGNPLTTTAKMVTLTRHVGIILLGFSTILFIKLSLWPLMKMVRMFDNSSERFILLAVAIILLLVMNLWIFFRLRSIILGFLLLLNIYMAVLAYLVRFPEWFHCIFKPNWPKYTLPYFALGLIVLFIAVPRMKRCTSKNTGK
jgi:hypothetical protein